MRLIPVMDLEAGLVVHAVKGERSQYQPLRSVICDSAEPLTVARAFSQKFGLTEIYVADLDAIQGRGENKEIVSSLVRQEGMRILLDAGAADEDSILSLLDLGVKKVIIGAETLPNMQQLSNLGSSTASDRLIFSLDMRDGQILSHSPDLAELKPLELLNRLQSAGWLEVILLDLARVGTGNGLDLTLISETRRLYPNLSLIVGGGIRHANDLIELNAMGISGALVATALHSGIISRNQLTFSSRTAG